MRPSRLPRHCRASGDPASPLARAGSPGRHGRPRGAIWLALALLVVAAPSLARTIVASAAPDRVAVTIYRDPNRPADRAPNLSFLAGYALVSETRRITLPAGESEIRFEGVAEGILPQSAIISGLGDGVIERNRDAYLLSPGTLIERSLGHRVHLRRTMAATGEVREEEAVIRSGADGALVLQTAAGIEALRCSGLNETIVYDEVPPGLSARPTLSVRARADAPLTATVTLSYLASGFDWRADYVAHVSEDGEAVDLFAWLTLANTDTTSFPDADTQAVAGRLNRADRRVPPAEARPINLDCWPADTTSDLPEEQRQDIVVTGSRIAAERAYAMAPPPPPPPAAPDAAMVATQEELGDVKLYRIPEPVTIAANSQKQVAFLARPRVAVRFVYRQTVAPVARGAPAPARRVMVARNRTADGLGVPLPAGSLVLFDGRGGRPILVGAGTIDDRAVGEDVEIGLGAATGVTSMLRVVGAGKRDRDFELVVTNDRPVPVHFEASLAGGEVRGASARLSRRDGMPLWTVTIPANGRATLTYSLPPLS